VTVACDWTGQVGEINANIKTLMTNEHPEITTAFTVHGDDAPTFYLSNNPAQADPATRALERAAATLTAVNPYTGATDRLMVRMADQAGMKLLHMYTAGDPLRDPTFAYFADPDYFLTDFPASTCLTCINPAFAWNHGDIQPEIATTWIGYVGPGVLHLGQTGRVWTDHTDIRPTMFALLGLADSYVSDGRVVTEVLRPSAVARSLRTHREAFEDLAAAYKQLNAPFGTLSLASLRTSTRALTSGTETDDSTYARLEARLAGWTARRDALASQMVALLDAAAFGGRSVDEHAVRRLIGRANALILEVVAAH
jgi:hypothetical protein